MKVPKDTYKQHPLIEGLKVNQDGSKIYYKGDLVKGLVYKLKDRGVPTLRMNFDNKSFCVAKLVCEAWHGPRPTTEYCVQRKYSYDHLHHTNLYWGKIGPNDLRSFLRYYKNSKVTAEDLPVVIDRLKSGDKLASIAKDYNTSDMSISRINKRFVTPYLKENETK